MMISTVIVTLNEEKKLLNCLESVKDFSDEIVVVDLGSTDHTLEIAKKYQAKIFTHPRVDYVELVRNFAIAKAQGDWILVLDPDETVPQSLKNKLKDVISEDKYTAVNISRKNIFFGKWISHTNWWPDRHVRFFKKGKVKWEKRIHLYPKVEGQILELPAKEDLAIEHFGYQTIGEFINRQNRYSSIEAQNLYNLVEKFSWGKLFWKPTREFLVRFIKHRGFLDGFYGFALTILMMVYQLQLMVKLWELKRTKK